MLLKNCRVILEDDILQSGCVSVVGDKIGCISAAVPSEEGVDLQGLYLAPGFVDIHCHGSGEHCFFDHPAEAAVRSLSLAALKNRALTSFSFAMTV